MAQTLDSRLAVLEKRAHIRRRFDQSGDEGDHALPPHLRELFAAKGAEDEPCIARLLPPHLQAIKDDLHFRRG